MWFLVGRVDTRPFFLCNIKKNGCCGVCCNNAGGRKKKIFEYFLEKKDTEYFVN